MKKIWHGEEKLWKVFWGGIFFPFALFFVIGFAGAIFHVSTEVRAFFRQPLFLAVNFLYTIGWAVAVWKCRNNSRSSAWKYLALLFLVLSVLLNTGSLVRKFHPPTLASYNPSCIKTLQDFAQQNGINPQQYLESNQTYLQKCTKEFYRNTCTKTMEDFAQKNGLNPQDYLKQNQPYLTQCAQSLEDHQNAGR